MNEQRGKSEIRHRRKIQAKNRLRLLFLGVCCMLSFFIGVLVGNINSQDAILVNGKGITEKILLNQTDSALKGKIIVVDAGHGGVDPGTLGPLTGVHEADLNFEISYKLKKELEKLGIEVVMTRTEKSTKALGTTKKFQISERGEIIKKANPDIVISIHQNFNAANSEIAGVQILASGENSEDLAQAMQDAFNAELNKELCYVIDDYGILKYTNKPSVIVECGFFSNKEEERLLQTKKYQDRLIAIMINEIKHQFSIIEG